MSVTEIMQQARALSAQERKELVKLLVDTLDVADKEKLKQVIETLKDVKNRPTLYILDDLGPIDNFMAGFELTCMKLGVPFNFKIAEEVIEEHGYRSTHYHIAQIRQKHSREVEVIEEELEIAIETWQRILDIIDE